MLGISLKRYKVLKEIGHGGMAVVYLGLDTNLERDVAIKVLHNHLARKDENRKRFQREAQAIARLKHPNILEIYDYSSDSEHEAYIVMEYIPGDNLQQFVDRHGPPPPEIAAIISVFLCRALEHAHESGIIHRDLKPENVMLSESGVIKLMDFGIAHVIGAESMTQTGSLLGSPAFMPPELIEGRRIDARADIFSLGTLLYWLSTGQLPFEGSNAPQVLANILNGDYVLPEALSPTVGHELSAIIQRCMERDPDARYATLNDVRESLVAFLGDHGIVDIESEFTKYFANPAHYAETFSQVIVPVLIERGQRAMATRQLGQAMHHFNRVLAYEPQNELVHDAMRTLSKRSPTSLYLGLVAVVTFAIGATIVVYNLHNPSPMQNIDEDVVLSSQEPVQPPLSPTALQTALQNLHTEMNRAIVQATRVALLHHDSNVVANQIIDAAQDRVDILSPRSRPNRPAPAAVDAPDSSLLVNDSSPKKPVPLDMDDEYAPVESMLPSAQLRFKISPLAATVYVNDQSFTAIQAANGISLPYGEHRLLARSPGCKPFQKTVVVDSPSPERIPIALEWEDSYVQILSDEDALVWIEDDPQPHPIGANGQNAVLLIPFGRADQVPSEKRVRLRIALRQNLQQTRSQVVSLRPGVQTAVNVNFSTEN